MLPFFARASFAKESLLSLAFQSEIAAHQHSCKRYARDRTAARTTPDDGTIRTDKFSQGESNVRQGGFGGPEDGRGSGSPFKKSAPRQSATEREEELRSIAFANAPKKVFELIGDPRTGIADDTSANPFEDVTVDMIWHQLSNEVHWFKYEFAGNSMKETHRDARLSEYAKNLMYVMRAKDPHRWTMDALAKKFRIRRQRVMAILALKEMECRAMEQGESMRGALSAYACPVYLDDVELDPATGEPVAYDTQAALSSKDGRSAEEEAAIEMDPRRLSNALPEFVKRTERLQLRLVDLMQQHDFDVDKFKASLEADVDRAEAYFRTHLPSEPTTVTPAENDEFSKPPPPPLIDFAAFRQSISRVADSLRPFVSVASLGESANTIRTAAEMSRRINKLTAQKGSGKQAAGKAADPALSGEARDTELSALKDMVVGISAAELEAAFFHMGMQDRSALLELVKEAAIRLNERGVDIAAATTKSSYKRDLGRDLKNIPPHQLPVDVFGFRPVAPSAHEEVAASSEALAQIMQNAHATAAKLGIKESNSGMRSIPDVRAMRRRVVEAAAVDDLCARFLHDEKSRNKSNPQARPSAMSEKMTKILNEMDPQAVQQLARYESALQLRAGGDKEAAERMLEQLKADGEGSTEPAVQSPFNAAGTFLDAPPRPPGQYPGTIDEVADWDLLAGFIDSNAAKKIYNRGSGDRHFVRLATYPAFEGYTLTDFDKVDEGEISRLNRLTAIKEDDEMWNQFQESLLANVGAAGEKLWDTSKPLREANLTSALNIPCVVYGIGADSKTGPALFVAMPDGSKRPLNHNELVFQARRAPKKKLAYHFKAIHKLHHVDTYGEMGRLGALASPE